MPPPLSTEQLYVINALNGWREYKLKHNVVLEGYGVRLRPVTHDDSEFIVKLRNMPHAIGKIGDSPTTVEMQNKWLEGYLNRDNDYYFIIESLSSKKLGTIGVYDIDRTSEEAEYGRLVIIPGSMAALPSCILLTDFCFNNLQLQLLKACVVATNKLVITFDQKLGYKIAGESTRTRQISGRSVTMVNIELKKGIWMTKRTQLISLAIKGEPFQVR